MSPLLSSKFFPFLQSYIIWTFTASTGTYSCVPGYLGVSVVDVLLLVSATHLLDDNTSSPPPRWVKQCGFSTWLAWSLCS